MVCYLGNVLAILAPKYSKNFMTVPIVDSQQEFIKTCYEQNVTYIVWASREMLNPSGLGYIRGGLKNLDPLDKPQNVGPYEFVKQIGSRRGWVNVFRLRKQ